MRPSFLFLSLAVHGAVLGGAVGVGGWPGASRPEVAVQSSVGSVPSMTFTMRHPPAPIELATANPADDPAQRPLQLPDLEVEPVELPAEPAESMAQLLDRLAAEGAARQAAEAAESRPIELPPLPPSLPLTVLKKREGETATPPAAATAGTGEVAKVASTMAAPSIDAARRSDNEPPRYPESARRAGHEGVVVLAVDVGADGAVRAVELRTPSRYPSLNREALRVVRGWRFEPAQRHGSAVASSTEVTIEFRLSDAVPALK